MPTGRYLIYGANGYTGALTAREAVRRGQQPVLAGRSESVRALAQELGLEARLFDLGDPAAAGRGLTGVAAVLHCAGPFAHTAARLAAACLQGGVHYLDITGEVTVFEALAARSAEAQRAGVALLPGVGFDVVPSDCLAAHLKRRLPSATRLRLAFHAGAHVSRGTATTVVENLHRGGLVRKAGVLTPVPAAWKTRLVDFGRGPRLTVTIPWGDLATAYRSTGIGDIEVYVAVTPGQWRGLRLLRLFRPLLGWRSVQSFLKGRVRAGAPGPNDEQRARGRSTLWGLAEDDRGGRAEAWVEGPEGYTLTVLASLLAVEKTLAGGLQPGYHTPAQAFGPDFLLELPGVTRRDA